MMKHIVLIVLPEGELLGFQPQLCLPNAYHWVQHHIRPKSRPRLYVTQRSNSACTLQGQGPAPKLPGSTPADLSLTNSASSQPSPMAHTVSLTTSWLSPDAHDQLLPFSTPLGTISKAFWPSFLRLVDSNWQPPASLPRFWLRRAVEHRRESDEARFADTEHQAAQMSECKSTTCPRPVLAADPRPASHGPVQPQGESGPKDVWRQDLHVKVQEQGHPHIRMGPSD